MEVNSREKCCYPECENYKKEFPEKSFFKVPANIHRCRIWLHSMGKPISSDVDAEKMHRNTRVCADHFEDFHFTSTLRTRLLPAAVPVRYEAGNIYNYKCLLQKDECLDTTKNCARNCVLPAVDPIIRSESPADLSEEFQKSPSESSSTNYVGSSKDSPPIKSPRSKRKKNEDSINCQSHQIENNTCSVLKSEKDNPTNVEPPPCMPIDFDVDTYVDFDVAEKTVVVNSDYEENHSVSLLDGVEGNKDQCDEQSVLETIKSEFCRVCGINEQSLIPIFDDSDMIDSHKVPLVKMLETYLPLQIERGDELPLNICYKCYDILHQWHELYVTCMAADRTFKNTFHHSQITVENDGEKFSHRVEDDPNVSTGGEHNYVKLMSVTEPVSEPVLLGNKENICCETCGFYVTGIKESEEISSEILDLLERIPARIRLYVCKYCADPFKNRYELKEHIVTCGKNPTICEICGAFVPRRKNFENHTLRNHDDKRIICDQCGESCKPYTFKNHQISKHSQPENHCCELCCKIVHSKKVLDFHMQNHLKGKFKTVKGIKPVCLDGNIVFVCPACKEMFNDKTSLIMHLNEVGPVKCPTCRLNLKNERFLLLHTCKTWTCQFCDKFFYNRMKWKDHELLHTGERPYKCNFCDANFRSMHQRTLHHRTHRLPLLECKYCSKKFKHSSSLRKHMDFHEGIEFVCPICEKSLRRRTSLYAHMRRHGKNHYI